MLVQYCFVWKYNHISLPRNYECQLFLMMNDSFMDKIQEKYLFIITTIDTERRGIESQSCFM